MNWKRLQENHRPHFYSIMLDRYSPKFLRGFLRYGSAISALGAFTLSFADFPIYFGKADGLFFLFTFIYLVMFFIEVFYRSMANHGLWSRVKEKHINEERLDYSLSSLLFVTDEIDISRAFFESRIGEEVMKRSGLLEEALNEFIYSNRVPLIGSSLVLEGQDWSLGEYASTVYDADKSLQSFLSSRSVNKLEFVGAARWVSEMEEKRMRKDRFWSRENLGAIPSIGTSWAYGVSEDLGKFGLLFENTENIFALDIENGYREREVSALENILERQEEANALIIEDDQKISRDIVGRLSRKMKLGVSLPSIEHKNIIELQWVSLISFYKERSDLEAELIKIFNQSVLVGNVILYINDLPGLLSRTKTSGINLPSILSPFLSSKSLQVIASSGNQDFHYFIETAPTILEKFERIIPDKTSVQASVRVLLEQVPLLEKQYKIIFSYPAILSITNAADRLLTYGEMPSKAIDLLFEIAPWAVDKKIKILTEADAVSFLSKKTGINAGAITNEEREKLEALEERMGDRVIGQEEAVRAVASAIKRVRSEVVNPDKPLASFLFIGPTGVGKTEVAKALCQNFFGEEGKILRFDMSEYSGPDALSRLIGDFALNKAGALSSRVRDNPYGLLLLDEFEKASPDCLDLFLQILDEGVFTDALSRQVSCRNLIIIATSNAGSGYIFESLRSGQDLKIEKGKIIEKIISENIFRAELLNRFDAIILFKNLSREQLKEVATLGLKKLNERLREKSLELIINEKLVDFLVEKGTDQKFGARPINRAITNNIENIIAEKIVSGETKPGTKIEIKTEELE